MLWLVAGLPILVTLAAGVTLALAQRTPAAASGAPVRRIAQIQMQDLAPDREAARRGLSAQLEVDPSRGEIELAFGPAAIDENQLELRLLHPVSEQYDRIVPLRGNGRLWRGHAAPWQPQAWEVRLQAPRGQWRLIGRLPREIPRTVLVPAVAP